MLFYKYMIYSLFFLTMLFVVVYFSSNKNKNFQNQKSYHNSINSPFYWILF